ncbi:hypothetical protein TrRE_jg441, partial [Triparma retinervis]
LPTLNSAFKAKSTCQPTVITILAVFSFVGLFVLSQTFSKDFVDGERVFVGTSNLRPGSNLEQKIVEGRVHLIDYQAGNGIFCELNFDLHKQNPSMYPMFRDLVKASGCNSAGNRQRYGFKKAVALARDYDLANDHPLNGVPQGFIFHESRCGSTLAANAFAAVENTRVYSESAPIASLIASTSADPTSIKDALYIMSRFSPTYFKFQSVLTFSILDITEAYPSVPFIFVYRDPVQVMVSHFKGSANHQSQARGSANTPNCARGRSHPQPGVQAALDSKLGSFGKASSEMFCAAHLSRICEEALKAISRSAGKGLPLGYEGLVDKLMADYMETHFSLKLTATDKDRLVYISGSYSKARTSGAQFHGDSDEKDKKASPMVVEAAGMFMKEGFDELQALEASREL